MGSAKMRDAMRPEMLDGFAGQPEVSKQLNVILGSARNRGQLPDHMLFSGPPGLGKTTLANIVANELGLPIVTASGPALETPADVLSLLQSRSEPGVVFIDEIHRMSKVAEETLYPAMEDGTVPIRIGDGASAEHLELPVTAFALVGATTQVGMVSGPLRDRFGFQGRLTLYTPEDLADIVKENAKKLGVGIDKHAALEIASRSRGTPRVANSLLSRVRDMVETQEGVKRVSKKLAQEALDMFGVDKLGVDAMGRHIIEVICEKFNGGPVGLGSIASAVGETPATLENVYEPHLMSVGLLSRSKQGRVATDKAYEHLGLEKRQ